MIVSQHSDMDPNLLILGGTAEASAFARRVAEAGLRAVLSYAGRVEVPRAQPVPVRVGGFGGVNRLAAYLAAEGITHVVDATHPFADVMSRNAVAACAAAQVPLVALVRAPWEVRPGWQEVADIEAAVAALDGDARRVFLAIGRMDVARFAAQPQHYYLLRFVDAPEVAPPLPSHELVVARGPFDVAGDRTLMERFGVDLVVSKNSGGDGARAKLDAAEAMGVPVLMIARPAVPERLELFDPGAVLDWVRR